MLVDNDYRCVIKSAVIQEERVSLPAGSEWLFSPIKERTIDTVGILEALP
jgi:hypothetical protein